MHDITFLNLTSTPVVAVAIFLSADLLTALIHHGMDRYGDPKCVVPFLAKIFIANRRHHARPLDILRHGPLANAAETLPIAIGMVLAAWLMDMLTWHVMLFSAAIAFTAVYHRILHLPADRTCKVFKVMQSMGILQDKRMHMHHHAKHDVHYSILSNAVNRFLARTNLLRRLERLIERFTGRKPFDLRELSDQARKEEANK